VDPIDGTTNFIHTNPLTCVSIGLAINKLPVLGVVYSPCSGEELFIAVKGSGAYLNGKRIHVSNAQTIADSIVVSSVSLSISICLSDSSLSPHTLSDDFPFS
jgi:fructose-1,6-bisphosphatase/inositol monophosphatase family enzyme